MTTVAVGGAGGMIGGHLVQRLVDEGHDVRAVDVKPLDQWWQHVEGTRQIWDTIDLSDLESCRAAVEGSRWVFNLAADMGGIGYIETSKADCMLTVLISTHMLVAARDAGVERFFYSSSACAYAANHQNRPRATALKESDAYPAQPEDGYGWEKLFTERMCRHFREDFGLQTRVARYHNIFGPPCTWTGGREKAPAAICRKVAEAVVSGDHRIKIWGDGNQTRSFCWVGDCIEGSMRIMACDYPDPLNLGSSELVTVNQLVDIVSDIAGVKVERSYDLSAPQGVRGRNSDNTLIQGVLGWEPSTSLRDGLELLFPWVLERVTLAR